MKETPKKILETAYTLLADFGYSTFSYGLIAEKMNISKGLIAYHFPQKAVIFEKLIEDYFAKVSDSIEQALNLDESATKLLNCYILGILQYVQNHKIQTCAVMEIISNHRADNGELVYISNDEVSKPIVEILNYGKESEDFFEFDSSIMANLIRNLIDSCSYQIAKGLCENEDYFISELIQYINHMVEMRK